MFTSNLSPRLLRVMAAFFVSLLFTLSLAAQVSLTGPYAQDFNTATPAALPGGWSFAESGTNANATLSSGTGSSNTGDTYLLGTAGEWALGGLQSGSLIPTVGVAFTNNTGATVTELQISYTGETWRVGATNRSDRLDFQYSVDATSLATGTWTNFDALDYANPGQPATGSGTQQHAVALAGTITGLSIPNGATFYLRWADFNASGADDAMGVDNFTLTAVGGGAVAPTVTDDPDSVTVATGDMAVFSVSASGTAPLAYQWRKGGNPLSDAGNVSGATSATLTLTNVQAADQADYDVVVTNSAGSDTSAAATLTVVVPVAPAVTTPPASQTVLAGGSVTFNVVATGTAPLAYQWNKNGFPIGSATGASLTLTNVQAGDAGNYTVTVTNSVGSDTSVPAVLTVVVPDLYWNLAAANLSQDWSGTTLITANDNWSAVPSTIGYLGQDITTGTGTNPQTLTGTSGVANDVDVIANQANPNGLSSGGVAEFDGIANPTIALQGSGTADAPHIVIHLDTRGRTNVSVAANLRDLDGSNDNAAQPVALQYRVGDTGPFTNLPDAFVADATQGPALSGLVTPVLATLPADADNQAKVQVRFLTTNAVGNDEWVGIDDIVVSSVTDGIARVFASPTGGNTLVNEAGLTTDAYTLRLNTAPAGPVTVRAIADAQTLVSADGLVFGATADIVLSDLQPKLVHVQAADDTVNEAATHFSIISHAIVASGDAAYSGALTLPSLTAGVVDDDGGTGVTRIHVIQGSGPISPLVGYQVTINGVVTGFFTGALGTRDGFFVQELDANADSDPTTSEGVYVFLGSSSPLAVTAAALNIGDVVTVTGRATEFNSLTEVDSVAAIAVDGTAALPAAMAVTLPLPATGHLERYEGMRISLPQTLTVTDNYDLGRFGQVILATGRRPQPTNIAAPGAPAQAQLAANLLNQILLDDGTSRSNPEPTPYLFDDGSGATLRAGDTTTGASGVLTYQFGAFMVQPDTAPVFSRGNARPATPPAVGGSLRVTIGNVLNLFNGDGAGGGFPTSRGATNYEEYQRQLAKTVAGIIGQAPDIMGLTEMENDGYGSTSALAQLVAALNAAAPVGTTYGYVDASAVDIVTDVIHCAFIYRIETVETVGAPAMLSSPYFNNHARNPLAQTFREKATGAVLTVSINHFRAKASVSSMSDGIVPNPNIDQGDGQGANNWLRTKEAEVLAAWLATDPTGSGDPDFLIIGDLNAYAQEDPITALKNAGYVNLTELYEGAAGYSYSFDGAFGHLDHALASPSLAAQATGTATWHVNSDEPIYYDYNTEDKSVAQQAINTGTPYRYSDHDPVIVGLNLIAAPTITTGPVAQTVAVGDSVTFSVSVIGYPAPTYQWRRNGMDIPGADGASYTIPSPVTADAGSYDVVVTNSAGSTVSAAVQLTVNPAPANLTLAGLTQIYDGTPRVVTAATVPAGLPVVITYAGSPTPPVNPGTYAVIATINHPDYTGSVSDSLVVTITALVRHAPVLNGGLDGSVQVLLPESATLNGSAWVSGDLLVPGTPSVRLNGQPTYGGTIDGSGAAAPSGHAITLNGGAVLRHVVRRTDALTLPVVAAPPAPVGTRNVSINSAGQSPGDFATLRNLTLNGNAGGLAVPPGTYGTFTANGSSRFLFGVAGGSEPQVYNLQGLTLNGSSRLVIVGPVILNLANGTTLNGSAGDLAHPEWLELNIAAGGLTLNGSVAFAGYVTAPEGTVTVNGNSTLTGGVIADRLTINGNGSLVQPSE